MLIETATGQALVDTGIGLADIRDPEGRVGQAAIAAAGFQFGEADTAIRQLERLGLRPADITDVLLTHGDPDHAGGLADFPHARVHLAAEELAALAAGDPRYRTPQFDHGPRWVPHGPSAARWFGLEARPVAIGGTEVLIIPLPGHTAGHVGVAVRANGCWHLHVGDAYYLRVELERDDHPVSQLAQRRAVDDTRRRLSLAELRRLTRDHADEVAFSATTTRVSCPPETEYSVS